MTERPLDDMPIVFLVMTANARENIYRATVIGKATPDRAYALRQAMIVGGVVVQVRDGGAAYLCPEVV